MYFKMYNGRLFKFKSGSDLDVETLLKNNLWVSNIFKMNDPMDIAIYVDKNRIIENINDELFECFYNDISKNLYCISLTKKYSNKRLWNYYSDGFKGFVLCYKPSSIRNALKEIDNVYSEGEIVYKDTRYDFSEHYDNFIRNNIKETIINQNILFTKHTSWQEENEYRFSLSSNYKWNEKNGFELHVKPSAIIIGYKIDIKKQEIIKKYCEENNIDLKIYKPDYYTNKRKMKTYDIRLFEKEKNMINV